MAKDRPLTRAFTEWQRAADEMLKLEKALASCVRQGEAGPGPIECARLKAALATIRPIADNLFQVAPAEARRDRKPVRQCASQSDHA
jgi:hypothetical protein